MNKRARIKQLDIEIREKVAESLQLGGKTHLCRCSSYFCIEMRKLLPKNVVITKNGIKTKDGEPLGENYISIKPEEIKIKIFALSLPNGDVKYYTSKERAINQVKIHIKTLRDTGLLKKERISLLLGEKIYVLDNMFYEIKSIKLEK